MDLNSSYTLGYTGGKNGESSHGSSGHAGGTRPGQTWKKPKDLIHVNVRIVGVVRVGVCMLCRQQRAVWSWGGSRCECYYVVRNTITCRAPTRCPKGDTFAKKPHELVYIRYRAVWTWGGSRCERYYPVRNTISRRAHRSCPKGGTFAKKKPMNLCACNSEQRERGWVPVWKLQCCRTLFIFKLCLFVYLSNSVRLQKFFFSGPRHAVVCV